MNNQLNQLIIAPTTLAGTSLTLIWQQPNNHQNIHGYQIFQDNQLIGSVPTSHTYFNVTHLDPETNYLFQVKTTPSDNKIFEDIGSLSVTTKAQGITVDITKPPYAIDPSGQTLSTEKLQQAIDDLPQNGILLIPANAEILSGALDLKSDMTLQIDGTLKGSLNPDDYIYSPKQRLKTTAHVNSDGLILTRYEGWEMACYRSLINAGHLNPQDRTTPNCQNITICGQGTIYGGGNQLGTAMKKIYADKKKYPRYVSDGIGGRRVRGRLISFIQCQNVHLTGITVQNPPCWTIHLIYCDTVTTNGIHIKSQGIDNGDGWDPDSSNNCMIFDTTFDTGDDCIALKSGKNPEGNQINIPCQNIEIFNLEMTSGHGMAIGSEESGGIANVSIHDCLIQGTDSGIELKANAVRGGYIRNVTIRDCQIDSLLVHSVSYNADGKPADHLPHFSKICLENVEIFGNSKDIDVMGHPIAAKNKAVELVGFENPHNPKDNTAYIEQISFDHVRLDNPTNTFFIDKSKNVNLRNAVTRNGDPVSIQFGQNIKNVTIDSHPNS
ncbi:glycosyl hydrolase family 28 protein [Lentilactobacillus diolivorans]|uniref:glycosyl hydrolase family 28 protein n=1 Tax=Lentilactobacillus diolivorans TaxID=179838 RepID=UPI0024688761|nr:glycosyl hydrolase family 28 protein [Lentilactobacillus diolivorans]MDH5105257.1 glycosyl hydrolase family 28 protein [Lentilactobacillus diolivorans]